MPNLNDYSCRFGDKVLNQYSRFIDNHYGERDVFSELKEKEFILHSNSNGEIKLSFLDNKEFKSVLLHKIDRSQIQDSNGQNYDSIYDVLNHYQLQSLFQQQQYLTELVEELRNKASEDGATLASEIQNYGINPQTDEGQRILIEIAREIAKHDPSALFQNIQNFGIDSRKIEGFQFLSEIAELDAKQTGDRSSGRIINYGIDSASREGQALLIKLAQIVVGLNPHLQEELSEQIANYQIDQTTPEGRLALIDIAEQAAKKNGYLTSLYIENYGIDATSPEGQAALIKIAKAAAENDGHGTSLFIRNYGIHAIPGSQSILIDIFKKSALENAEKAVELIQNYNFDAANPDWQIALFEVGNRYKNGFGVLQDWNKARLFFEQAADGGHLESAEGIEEISFHIGQLYEFGKQNISANLVLAKKYYELAAEKGAYAYRGTAFYRLGRMFALGLGEVIDRQKAIELFKQAVEWKINDARLYLAHQYRMEGALDLADQCDADYREARLKEIEDITEMGGEILSLSINRGDLEEDIYSIDAHMADAFSREISQLRTLLESTGEISRDEVIAPQKFEGGVCAGMVMEFIFELQRQPFLRSEQLFKAVSSQFSNRSGVTAVALQALYGHLHQRPGNIHIYQFDSLTSSNTLSPRSFHKKVRDRDYVSKQPILSVHGQRIVLLPELGTSGEDSELNYLRRWNEGQPDGEYPLNITMENGYHDLCLIKWQSNVYLWDPNYGLIKCPATSPQYMIVDYLAQQYPGIRNHNLNIRRVEKLQQT